MHSTLSASSGAARSTIAARCCTRPRSGSTTCSSRTPGGRRAASRSGDHSRLFPVISSLRSSCRCANMVSSRRSFRLPSRVQHSSRRCTAACSVRTICSSSCSSCSAGSPNGYTRSSGVSVRTTYPGSAPSARGAARRRACGTRGSRADGRAATAARTAAVSPTRPTRATHGSTPRGRPRATPAHPARQAPARTATRAWCVSVT